MLGWWVKRKLDSKRSVARLEALEALVEKDDRSALAKLMEILVDDPDAVVVKKAAWALGELGGEVQFEELFSGLEVEDGKCRRRLEGLIELDYEATVTRLPGSEGHEDAKEALLALLPEIGDETAKGAMVELLSDPAYCVREGAAKGLRQLGWNPQSRRERILTAIAEGEWLNAPAYGRDAIEPLLGLLYPGSPVDREVIAALAAVGDERAIEQIFAFIKNAGAGGDKTEGRGGKAGRDASAATALLVALLDSPEMTTRATAARVLARLNWTPPNDELAVKYAVASGDPGKALEFGGDARERLLETALNDNVPLAERWEFLLALRDFEPEGLFDILMSVLERNTDGLGHRAAEALGELSDPRALEALLAEAHPSSVIDPELTRSATRAVAKFADGRATRFLLELQKSEDSVGLAVELLGEHLGSHARSIDSGLLREIATMVEIDQVVMEHDGGWHQKKVDHSLVKELATRELETRATS